MMNNYMVSVIALFHLPKVCTLFAPILYNIASDIWTSGQYSNLVLRTGNF